MFLKKFLKLIDAFLNKQHPAMATGAPPGPAPRPGLQWNPQSHRWIRPDEYGGPGGVAPAMQRQFDHLKNLFYEDAIQDPHDRQMLTQVAIAANRQGGQLSPAHQQTLSYLHGKYGKQQLAGVGDREPGKPGRPRKNPMM